MHLFINPFAMRQSTKIIFATLLLSSCILLIGHNAFRKVVMLRPQKARALNAPIHTIENIPLPSGYERVKVATSSFGEWVRKLPLRSNNTIYLYRFPAGNKMVFDFVICGYRVEDIEDKLVQKVRYLDKLIDELAKGKAMEKILRR